MTSGVGFCRPKDKSNKNNTVYKPQVNKEVDFIAKDTQVRRALLTINNPKPDWTHDKIKEIEEVLTTI